MNPECGQINPECGQIKWPNKLESGQMKDKSGTMKGESGQIKWPDKLESGQIKSVKAYDAEGQDRAVLDIVRKNPGIKLDAIFLEIRTSTHSVRRVLGREGLIEGRVPQLHISAKVAALTGQQASYMQKRQLAGRHYRQLIIDYLGKFPGASRKKLNEFLFDEIRGELSIEEKL